MSIAKITLYGMYQYDNTLFDDLEFPFSDLLDKETAVDQILLDCGEFEVLYSDWDFLKNAITQWGKKWYFTFQKWLEALEVEYDPLENYYRREHWEDSGEKENTNTTSSTVSNSGTNTYSGETKHSARTYDNGTMTEIERNNNSANESYSNSSTDTTGSEDAETSSNTRDGYARGNIGVTTSQQMLLSSLELYKGFNLYEQIANIFKTEMVLAIYE